MDKFQGNKKSLHIDILAEAASFKITIGEKLPGREIALRQYFRKDISWPHIDNISQKILSLLYRNTHSCGDKEGEAHHLRQMGQDLYDHILPLQVKEYLTASEAESLLLTIDDRLVVIPWELLHDGKEFLCRRFAMGRLVNTAQQVPKREIQDLSKGIKVLILSDPKGDLLESKKEGLRLQEEMEKLNEHLEVHFFSTDIKVETVRRMLRDCDLVHYAGHAEYYSDNPSMSGWLLQDGNLTAQDIMAMAGSSGTLPLLIFSNACKTGHTAKWEIEERIPTAPFDLVNAFLLAGVQHYIGAFQDISDEASLDIALNFYQSLLNGESIGASLQKARSQFSNKYGQDNLTWASYMLYGDPTAYYLSQGIDKNEPSEESKASPIGQIPVYFEPAVSRGSSSRSGSITSVGRVDSAPSWKMAMKIFSFGLLVVLLVASIVVISFVGKNIINKAEKTPIISPIETKDQWEQEKWNIVNDIIHKLETRYKEKGESTPILSKESAFPITICIMRDKMHHPDGKEDKVLNGLIEQFIEEESLYWLKQRNFSVVERARLDFVLGELARASSSISEKKLNFVLGHVLGAKGIIFVKALPIYSSDKGYQLYLRFIDTETSAIKAIARSDSLIGQDISALARDLGAEIIAMLKKNNVYNILSQ
ncbi:MAG: CHAT domain-containing protein [bacterium]